MKQIDKSKYTHYASFWGVPCYFNIYTDELTGRGMISEFFLNNFAIHFDGFIMIMCSLFDPLYEPEFKIKIGKRINNSMEEF